MPISAIQTTCQTPLKVQLPALVSSNVRPSAARYTLAMRDRGMSEFGERRSVRFRMSGPIRQSVLGALGIPYSRHGLDLGLIPFLPEGQPITLIDIGASSGQFTGTVIDHCGITRALLVEAQPTRYRELRERFHD